MKKFLALAFVLTFSCSTAFSQEKTPKFFLEDDGTSTLRLEKVESKVADLEKRVTALEKSPLKSTQPKTLLESGPGTLGSSPKTFTLTPASKVRFSVCVGGSCTIYECDDISQVPAGATILSGVATSTSGNGGPCPMGLCGDNCNCANLSMSAFSSSSGSSCASGSCGSSSSGRTGWYPGKRRGR